MRETAPPAAVPSVPVVAIEVFEGDETEPGIKIFEDGRIETKTTHSDAQGNQSASWKYAATIHQDWSVTRDALAIGSLDAQGSFVPVGTGWPTMTVVGDRLTVGTAWMQVAADGAITSSKPPRRPMTAKNTEAPEARRRLLLAFAVIFGAPTTLAPPPPPVTRQPS